MVDCMKCNTVEQFKILQYVKQNFDIDKISLMLVDRYSIKVTDKTSQSLIFKYSRNTIIWE